MVGFQVLIVHCHLSPALLSYIDDDTAQFIGTGISLHSQTVANDCRFGGVWGDPVGAFGGGAAISSKVDDRKICSFYLDNVTLNICSHSAGSGRQPGAIFETRTLWVLVLSGEFKQQVGHCSWLEYHRHVVRSKFPPIPARFV